MFTLQLSFKPLLLKGGGGGVNPLIEVTVNSKEENFSAFCPNFVQEFGLCTESQSWACIHKRFIVFKKTGFQQYLAGLLLYLRSILKLSIPAQVTLQIKARWGKLTCGLSRWRVWAGPCV